MAANKQDKPLFIGGFRSGTTLLVNLLGMHDDLAPWFETKCLCEALRYLRVLRDPGSEAFEAQYCAPAEPAGFSAAAVLERMRIQMRATHARISGETASGKAAHERYPLGHDCLRYSLDQGLEALQTWETALRENPGQAGVCQATGALIAQLGRLHAQGFGRPHWVNMTPEISRFAAELRASLGPCRVLYMLRNGLDVVSSAGGALPVGASPAGGRACRDLSPAASPAADRASASSSPADIVSSRPRRTRRAR